MHIVSRTLLLLLLGALPIIVFGKSFTTGLLQTERGFFDPGSGARVETASTIYEVRKPDTSQLTWSGRYVLVLLPIRRNDIQRVKILTATGKVVPQFSKMNVFERYDPVSGNTFTGLKLYLKLQADLQFRIEVTYK